MAWSQHMLSSSWGFQCLKAKSVRTMTVLCNTTGCYGRWLWVCSWFRQTEVLFYLFIYLFCSSEGDFRMVIGEDKSKVANIVKDNIQHFRILYSNILRDCPQVVYKPHQGKLEVWYCKQAPEEYTLSFSISDIWATQLSLDIGYFYRVSAE